MLNRIRFGKQSDDDLKVLESRVRPEGHPDLEGAMLISPRKLKVARFVEKCINELKGNFYKSNAVRSVSLFWFLRVSFLLMTGPFGPLSVLVGFPVYTGIDIFIVMMNENQISLL